MRSEQLSDPLTSDQLSDGARLGRIEAALGNPLLSSAVRSGLRKRQEVLLNRLREGADSPGNGCDSGGDQRQECGINAESRCTARPLQLGNPTGSGRGQR